MKTTWSSKKNFLQLSFCLYGSTDPAGALPWINPDTIRIRIHQTVYNSLVQIWIFTEISAETVQFLYSWLWYWRGWAPLALLPGRFPAAPAGQRRQIPAAQRSQPFLTAHLALSGSWPAAAAAQAALSHGPFWQFEKGGTGAGQGL